MLITFTDGSQAEFPAGTTPQDILKERKRPGDPLVVGARVDGQPVDLTRPLHQDTRLEFLTFDDPEGRDIYRHSSAHLMAQAVRELYPGAQLGIGPALEDSFYYDIQLPEFLNPEDLAKIEARMAEIVQRKLRIERQDVSKEEAAKLFRERGENLKLELLDEMDDAISVYRQGDFVDLCRGPHLPTTGYIKHFKLLSLAGAYWRGDESKPMLQRIYGTSYPTAEALQEHLHRYEEAKKRDHRRLGRELDLFSFHPEAPGTPFWHPKGLVLMEQAIQYWRQMHQRAGYQEIRTPLILSDVLWRMSGHYDHYRENMYFSRMEDRDYAVKPMNCPSGLLVYKTYQFSYRDLPVRFAELGHVHRFEKSGELHGLIRVRAFTQDDAHIYCTPDQIESEVVNLIGLIFEIYNTFGFHEVRVELSTQPEKSIGSAEMWRRAEKALENALAKADLPYELNPGEGAFYGPKIDFHIKDSLGRSWQCGTIQMDFSMPERFELEYIGADGERHRPVMIHRAILGSLERFIGLLIEHYAGDFPLWLAPVQARILPITDKQHDYARALRERFQAAGLRVEADLRNEKVGYKIRQAELEKVPLMLVVGGREAESGAVSLRVKGQGDQGSRTPDEVIALMREAVDQKRSLLKEDEH
ncbi:MAG: threonine--tRNA ligase [Candidatus Zixiibacteriota bacterium]|nr:MAG: threonine--tRNA ligase [candidate division Zixibacteria bacterium]